MNSTSAIVQSLAWWNDYRIVLNKPVNFEDRGNDNDNWIMVELALENVSRSLVALIKSPQSLVLMGGIDGLKISFQATSTQLMGCCVMVLINCWYPCDIRGRRKHGSTKASKRRDIL
jgi:hypothetical protein